MTDEAVGETAIEIANHFISAIVGMLSE